MTTVEGSATSNPPEKNEPAQKERDSPEGTSQPGRNEPARKERASPERTSPRQEGTRQEGTRKKNECFSCLESKTPYIFRSNRQPRGPAGAGSASGRSGEASEGPAIAYRRGQQCKPMRQMMFSATQSAAIMAEKRYGDIAQRCFLRLVFYSVPCRFNLAGAHVTVNMRGRRGGRLRVTSVSGDGNAG
jgi:hypothetical protein